MQSSQKTKTKGEEVLEMRSKTVTTTVKDISPSGVTLELNSEGQSKGKINAQGIATTTVVMKTDGTSTWENKGIFNTNDGDMLVIWGKGTGKSVSPSAQAWEGEMHAMSQSPKLAWLNNAKLWTEGKGDRAKNESVAKVYQVK
jgi:hypothetical protein